MVLEARNISTAVATRTTMYQRSTICSIPRLHLFSLMNVLNVSMSNLSRNWKENKIIGIMELVSFNFNFKVCTLLVAGLISVGLLMIVLSLEVGFQVYHYYLSL